MSWVLARDKHKYGVAIENFTGENESCLNLTVGDTVHVLEVCGNEWAYGYIICNQDIKGIFPRRYIQVKNCIVDRSGPVERVIPNLPPIILELTAALREWRLLLRQHFVNNRYEYKTAHDSVENLISLRKTVLSGNLPTDELKKLKQKLTHKIDEVNRLLGLDLVVRDDEGNILNTKVTSTTVLYNCHKHTDELLSKGPNKSSDDSTNTAPKKYHLAWTIEVSFTNIIFKVAVPCVVSVSLHALKPDCSRSKALSEPYVFHWTPDGYTENTDLFNSLCCMYTDLSEKVLTGSGSLWLVGIVVQEGRAPPISLSERRKSTTVMVTKLNIQDNIRRPFGVFAADVSHIIKRQFDLFSPRGSILNTAQDEIKAKFIKCSEKESLEMVYKRLMTQSSDSKANDESVVMNITLHNGDVQTLSYDHPHHKPFKEVMAVPAMSLAEVIVPGYVRNDMYITLMGAEISRGSKMNDRNVEVTVTVYDKNNKLLKGVLSCGVGCSHLDEYRTVTYHHEGKPRWLEAVKVALPIDEFKGAHVRFLFKHRSMSEGKEKPSKLFALAFTSLMLKNGTTLANKDHELCVYNIEPKKWKEEEFEYLKLPCLRIEAQEQNIKKTPSGLSLASKDTFIISTTFCSTKLTQNERLLRLLEWGGRLSQDSDCLRSNKTAVQMNGNAEAKTPSQADAADPAQGEGSPAEQLKQCLSELKRVDMEELITFLQDTLDVLLHLLLKAPQENNLDNAVFEAFVEVVYIAGKQHKGEPVLKAYIDHNFSAALVYSKLITLLKHYIEKSIRPASVIRSSYRDSGSSMERFNMSNASLERTEGHFIEASVDAEDQGVGPGSILNKALKSLPYLMKFIIKSRQLYAKYYVEGHESFCTSLEGLFESMFHLMSRGDASVAAQRLFLRYLPDIIPDVMTVFNPVTLSKLLIKILTNIVRSEVQSHKLMAIEQICNSSLFKEDNCREPLIKAFVKLLQGLLETALEVAKVVQILETILHVLHTKKDSPVTLSHMQYVTDELLHQILSLASKTPHTNSIAARYVSILIGLVRQVSEPHLLVFFSENHEVFFPDLIIAIRCFISNSVFPPDWAEMTLLLNNILLTLLRVSAKVIQDKMKEPFRKEVWNNWFHVTIQFITQPSLQLNEFLPSKRNKIRTLYQDMRKIAADEVKRMWYGLGKHKLVFLSRDSVMTLVAPMLEMTLIQEPELRRSTIPIFFDMMQCEYNSPQMQGYQVMADKDVPIKAHFDDFENEMLVQLDRYITSGHGDDHYCTVFNEIMMELCSNHNTLASPGRRFVRIISSQMTRLLQYRLILDSPDHSLETRMCSTVNLLDFYSNFSNKALYVRYVHKLVDLHIQSGNLTEAGFALSEHAKILSWNQKKELSHSLKSDRYPYIKFHGLLKEQLYNDIINYMEESGMWECALVFCKELASHYENTVMDYTKLAELLARMSNCYKSITDPGTIRPDPEYFRVAYYGRGFPAFLQNKIFIHRGNGYERLIDFQCRMMDQFPNAKPLTKLTSPEKEMQESPEQYIQINTVECVVDESNFTKPGVSEAIRKFYRANHIEQFTYSRPFHRGEKVPNNEFATLWVEKTILQTGYKLPGILRCFPVVNIKTVELTPVQNAIETMKSTNKELSDLVQSHNLRTDLPLDSLTRKLSGMIDAAVMGGVANYEKAFLHEEYSSAHPEEQPQLDALKRLISEMIPLLELGLMVHAEKVSDQIFALHDHMLTEFSKMKKLMIEKYGESTAPQLGIDRRSLRPLRQVSLEGSGVSTRSSHYVESSSPHHSLQRKSIGGGTSTLPRNKHSTSSLTIITSNSKNRKEKNKLRSLLRRDSQSQGQSLFYEQSPLQQPLREISETLVAERPRRSEVSSGSSRPTSLVSSATLQSEASSRSHTPTPSTGGSVESLSTNRDSEVMRVSSKDEPPPLPVKTKHNSFVSSDMSSFRSEVMAFIEGSPDLSPDGGRSPPKKPPRPSELVMPTLQINTDESRPSQSY